MSFLFGSASKASILSIITFGISSVSLIYVNYTLTNLLNFKFSFIQLLLNSTFSNFLKNSNKIGITSRKLLPYNVGCVSLLLTL